MKKTDNGYDGIIEQWKVDLALSRIRAFRFPKHEWDGLLQHLVLVMARFQFDPTKANGAKESTALSAVINNRLISVRRSVHRNLERRAEYRDQNGLSRSNANRHPLLVEEHEPGLPLDVQLAVGTLSPMEQAVCMGLSQGDSIRRLASRHHCSCRQIRRMIAQIRCRFTELSLDGWAGSK